MQEQSGKSNEAVKKILMYVKTKEERDEIISVIEKVRGNFYTLDGDKAKNIFKMHMPYRFLHFFEEAVEETGTKEQPDDWGQFLLDLKKGLEDMEILKIDLAIEPNEELINQIHSWIRREIGKNIIFEIHNDKTILGGIRLVYRGRYVTLTLKDHIWKVINRHKQKILEIMQEK